MRVIRDDLKAITGEQRIEIGVGASRMMEFDGETADASQPSHIALEQLHFGSTPDPVTVASAIGDTVGLQGKILFDASPSVNVVTYELRTCLGTTYRVSDETVVESLDAKTPPLQFLTKAGLSTSGASRLFRIYAITSDGNEKGSPNIRITRP